MRRALSADVLRGWKESHLELLQGMESLGVHFPAPGENPGVVSFHLCVCTVYRVQFGVGHLRLTPCTHPPEPVDKGSLLKIGWVRPEGCLSPD